MSRVLMINSPFYRLLGSRYNAMSLGLSYIASYLNANGHDSWVYNADHMSDHQHKNLLSLFKNNYNYKQYFEKPEEHEIWDEVVKKIMDFNPDWVGWFCYTANFMAIKILSEKLKKNAPNIKQVVGGPHSSLDNDLLNRLPHVDYAVQREGEECMLQLVNGKDPKKIQGVVSRLPFFKLHNTGAAPFVDRDKLPFPEREKFWGVTAEEKKKIDVSYVIRNLACPFDCHYCASPGVWGRRVQMRSNDSMVAEVKHIIENYWNQENEYDYAASANTTAKDSLIINSNSKIYFVDDIFGLNKKKFLPLMDRFINEIGYFPWKCENRADLLDHDICSKMKEAGCEMIKLGIESGSDKILKQISKRETREDYIKCTKVLKDTGMKCGIYLMTGFPNETDEDLEETISLAKYLYDEGVVRYFSLSVLAPYFGTQIYYDLVEQGYGNLANDDVWSNFFHQSSDLMVNNILSKKKIQEFLDLAKFNPKEYV